MNQKIGNIINGVKRFIRCCPGDTIWLFRHYEELKQELERLDIRRIRPYKFVSWHSGFNYFIGLYKEEVVFVKVCVGEYDTIKTEGKMKEYNESCFFPEVIAYSVSNLNYIVTKFIYTKKMERTMPMEVQLSIISQAEEILDKLWKYGIVHRDIRPENLLLTETNKLLLFDFGWALYRDDNYKRSNYPFIEKIVNIQYRGEARDFDDAFSMYLSLKEILGDGSEELLINIKERVGRFSIK